MIALSYPEALRSFRFWRSSTITIIAPSRRVYQCSDTSEFKVDVDIHSCVHGYLGKDRKQPASLIVFSTQLTCLDKGTFNLFRMEVDFCDQDGAVNPCKPQVIATAPFSVEERLHEDVRSIREKVTDMVENNAEASITVPIQASLGGKLGHTTQRTKERETNYQEHYFSKGSSNTRCDESGLRNGVWWNVRKGRDPVTGDDVGGIPPNYRFAVLITRTNDDTPFEAHVQLFVEAGWAHKTEKILQLLLGKMPGKKKRLASKTRRSHDLSRLVNLAVGDHEGEADPVLFDPRNRLEGRCDNIDRESLGKFRDENELAKLTVVPNSRTDVRI